jgi:hypothetical protein
MYTNICTKHALEVFSNFFNSHPLERNLPLKIAILSAIGIIMTNNVFKFGDTFFLQTSGIAMGAPPACMYATLYYYVHEEHLMDHYKQQFLPTNGTSMTSLLSLISLPLSLTRQLSNKA